MRRSPGVVLAARSVGTLPPARGRPGAAHQPRQALDDDALALGADAAHQVACRLQAVDQPRNLAGAHAAPLAIAGLAGTDEGGGLLGAVLAQRRLAAQPLLDQPVPYHAVRGARPLPLL